ncbi:MAG: toxin-antitoxin system HicB family antitoxin [Rhodanobacter sp.]
MNADRYTYRVTWSQEDGEYVGLCAEFPSLSWLASSQARALSGITALLREVLADMHKTGEKIPDPISTKQYSGKFQVRIPPDRHRALAVAAAESGISLNRLVSDRLCA